MPFHNHFHEPASRHSDFLLHHPIRAFYIGDSIKGFGLGMFGIFLPVYFLTLFTDAGFSNPLAWIFIYYAVLDFIATVGMYVAPRFLPKYGFRNFVLVAFASLALHLVFLVQAEANLYMLIPAVLTAAIYRGMFWPGYHILFARMTSKGHRGEAVGKRAALMKFSRVASPAIGGFLIARYDFSFVLWLVVGFVLAASIPYLTANMHDGHRGGPKPILREIHKTGGVRAGIAISAMGMVLILAAVVWPLYLYSIGIGFEALGIITTGAALVTVLSLYLFGRFSDRNTHGGLLKKMAPLYAAAWSFRIAARGVVSAFAADSIAGLTGSLMAVPFDAHLYERLQNESPHDQVHTIIFREIVINGGRALLGVIVVLYIFAGGGLRWLMLLGIPLSLSVPLIRWWPHRESKLPDTGSEGA